MAHELIIQTSAVRSEVNEVLYFHYLIIYTETATQMTENPPNNSTFTIYFLPNNFTYTFFYFLIIFLCFSLQ